MQLTSTKPNRILYFFLCLSVYHTFSVSECVFVISVVLVIRMMIMMVVVMMILISAS